MSRLQLFSESKPHFPNQLGARILPIIRWNTNSRSLFSEIVFFDSNQTPVGQGTFQSAATPFEGDFINPLGQASVKIEFAENWFKVLRFQAQISGLTWSLSDKEDFQLFWCPTQFKTWAISYSNLGEASKVEGWRFGDSANFPVLTVYENRWVQINSEGENIGHNWMLKP